MSSEKEVIIFYYQNEVISMSAFLGDSLEFVLLGDDDTYVNIPALFAILFEQRVIKWVGKEWPVKVEHRNF